MELFLLLLGVAVLILIVRSFNSTSKRDKEERERQEVEKKRVAAMPYIEKEIYLAERQRAIAKAQEAQKIALNALHYGPISAAMVCPHCQTKGGIRTKQITQKKGVSGGKATAAVLTGGVSLLAVGLSRKEGATQAHCDNCNNTWMF